MNRSIPLVPVERDYLDELIKKAAAWDRYHTKSGENSHLYEDLCLAVRLNDKIDKIWTVPLAQTIIVTNLPSSMGGAKLMNSFWAVRGIRCYQMFTIPGSTPHTTALITFITPTCAKEYLSYVSEYGFFLSERLLPGYAISDTEDECIYISPDSQFQCLFRRAPHVMLKPWLGPGKTDGKFITGNEGGYCNVSLEIAKEGATRSLRIIPGVEPKELRRTLSYLAAELKVESCRLTALASTKVLATTICFCSVHDAAIVKTYLTSQKAFSGPDGRIVSYVKSPTDKSIENLGWHNVSKPWPIETLPVGRGVTLGVPEANGNTHKSLTKNDLCPFLAVGEPANYRCTVEHSEGEESDTDIDNREISFSLAKESFLPYISTNSSTRTCLTGLSHTPMGHSPPRPRPEIHPNIRDEERYDYSPVVNELLSPYLEINTHLPDKIDRDSESYRDEIITPKEAEPMRDVYLTEIHQSSRDPIVAVNIVNSKPSMLETSTFHPGSGEMSSSFNEVLLSTPLNKTARLRSFQLDEIAQTQDAPGVATQAGVLVYRSLSPEKVEIEIVDRLELDPPKNSLKLLSTNQVRSEPNSTEGSIENFLDTLPLLNKELLESWMDDF